MPDMSKCFSHHTNRENPLTPFFLFTTLFVSRSKQQVDALSVDIKKAVELFIQQPSYKLGYPDSNQKRQDQNLQCYHYTIPQTHVYPQPKDKAL